MHGWSVHHTWYLHVICAPSLILTCVICALCLILTFVICVPCMMILTAYLICAPYLMLTCDLCAMSDDTYHIFDLCTTPDTYMWSVCYVWWYLPHIWSVHHAWSYPHHGSEQVRGSPAIHKSSGHGYMAVGAISTEIKPSIHYFLKLLQI